MVLRMKACPQHSTGKEGVTISLKIIASSELPLANLLLAGITAANTECSINGAIVDVEYQIEEELRSSYSDDTETFTVSKSLTLEGQKKRLLLAALTAMREAA